MCGLFVFLLIHVFLEETLTKFEDAAEKNPVGCTSQENDAHLPVRDLDIWLAICARKQNEWQAKWNKPKKHPAELIWNLKKTSWKLNMKRHYLNISFWPQQKPESQIIYIQQVKISAA